MVTIENPDTKFTRFLYLPGLDDMAGFSASINEAKEKAASLTDRIRQQKGLAPASAPAAAPVASSAAAAAVQRAAAPAPTPVVAAPTPTPAAEENFDTVALSGMADDLSEFETKIKKLKVLRDNGILSEEEYETEKKKLVSIF